MNHIPLRKIFIRFAAIMLAMFVLLTSSAAAYQPQVITAQTCYARSKGSILYVRSYYQSGALKATGSGFIITEDGLAVTAAHVVNNGAKTTVIMQDGTELAVTIASCDTETDVAVLKLPAGKYASLTLGQAAPDGGSLLRAMGFPAKDTLVITEGIVASPEGTISGKTRILVTCDIVNGMSGGPIFNQYGEVVGVVSGSIRTMDGIHLSVTSNSLFNAVSTAKNTKGTSK